MRFDVRLLLAIWLPVTVILAAFAYVSVEKERTRLTEDLERQAWLLSEGLKEAVEPLVGKTPAAAKQIDRIIRRFGSPTRGVAVFDRSAALVGATPDLASARSDPVPAFVAETIAASEPRKGIERLAGGEVYYYAVPLVAGDRVVGALVTLEDAGAIERGLDDLIRTHALRFVVLAAALSLITLVVVRRRVTHPLRALAEWARQLRAGRPVPVPGLPDPQLFGPLAIEVSGLARSLAKARAATEAEAMLRLHGESIWTEEGLKQYARARLGDRPLVVVSNREPVSHVWRGRRVEVLIPASGVVTAMEPIMRACGGVWVAHGSGDADREVVDAGDKLRVPPDDPRYTLRRVWLTEEEEQGYYYGFANEGLWPLCHIVHARPTFRSEDWMQYAAVNRKFADAVLAEVQETANPAILIQDYHFALVPRFIKESRGDARVALFWHIPWPNPEAFGICPWQSQILQGMLGADLVGFHTQFHCNNFLETVDRAIEARIDWERFCVVRGQQSTEVKPFPISVAPQFVDEPPRGSRESFLHELGVSAEFVGVGVERIDYTKGLPERLGALRRFFERYPEYRERVVFVQLASPSRSRISRYRELEEEVERLVESINADLQTGSWRPILFLKGHHNHRDIWPFYRWTDFCMVTSLHDGMNLVAKEFVSVRDDEDGVLILSRFTGASRELGDALLVNPYDLDEMADAIRAAVTMPRGERKGRMARMRQTVREHNIYRWAGRLLRELSRLPVENHEPRD